MNPLWAVQKGLADALTTAGLATSPEIPERGIAPFRYVLLDGVGFGPQVGSWTVALTVVCVARSGTNAVMSESVLGMAVGIVNAVPAFDGYELAADTIEKPAAFSVNGKSTLAVGVSVTARISRAQMKGTP